MDSPDGPPPALRSVGLTHGFRAAGFAHVPALFLVTAVCGLVDAACFLSLGEVFAEMMTGNLLLFCFYIGTGHALLDRYAYLLALAAFGLGSLAGGRINRGPRGHTRMGFGIEWVFVVAALIAAFGLDTVGSEAARNFIVCLLSVAMGLQNGLLRRHGVPDLATNVMTPTMVALYADSTLSGGNNERWQRRLGSIPVFMASAMAGAALTHFIGPWAPLSFAAALFSLALVGLTYQHPGKV